ncbi:DUF4384 domain-containing protein [Desulfococcaceae bacterium HSG7]|nr:DUF4384 domain-containing protein [Desulfococcaceae bacterium HSG7]
MDYKPSQNNEEPADRLIEEFRQASLKRPPDFAEECVRTDKVMDYALNEAEPQEHAEIEEHLTTCRACMKLYFDTCMTKTWAEESSLQTVPMSAELRAAIKKKPPAPATDSIFQQITSDVYGYLSSLIIPQDLALLKASIAMTAKPMAFRDTSSQAAPYRLNAGDTLKTGEQFQVKITTDKDTYGYVILAGASGRINTLYSGEFKADEAKVIPDVEEWEKLDYRSGTEQIYLIATKGPVGDFDKKIRELKAAESIKELRPYASLHPLFEFKHE